MKVVLVLLVVVVLGYAAYCGILAAGTYLEVSQIIDDAFVDIRPGIIESARQALGGERPDVAARLREAILTKTTKSHLPVGADDVKVTDAPEQVLVRVKWIQPLVVYQSDVLLALPLSVTRSFGPDRLGR